MDTHARVPETQTAFASLAPAALKLHSVKETMTLLGVGRSMLWRLTKEKQLPSILIGARRMFSAADIAAFINSRREA
jgi:predicted DNA-binding transcriptional regulator AlpA